MCLSSGNFSHSLPHNAQASTQALQINAANGPPRATIDACKLRLLDTLACVAGAYSHPVPVSARGLAERYRMNDTASVLGSEKAKRYLTDLKASGVQLAPGNSRSPSGSAAAPRPPAGPSSQA